MPVNHSQNIIELKNVSFSYGSIPVLQNISFNIHTGDYLGIVGPNGGGKTTLLKLILGLLNPTQGEIKLFGKRIEEFENWPKIGYVPQKLLNFDQNFPATVEEIVTMGLYGKKGLFRRLNKEDRKQIDQAIDYAEISEYKMRLIGELSSGQQQRVFIARAMAARPAIIFLDEPTVGVDIKAQEKFYNLLQKMNQSLNITLVFISHDIDVVARETTEVACINQILIYHGSPKEFIKTETLEKLYGKDVKFILHKH